MGLGWVHTCCPHPTLYARLLDPENDPGLSAPCDLFPIFHTGGGAPLCLGEVLRSTSLWGGPTVRTRPVAAGGSCRGGLGLTGPS